MSDKKSAADAIREKLHKDLESIRAGNYEPDKFVWGHVELGEILINTYLTGAISMQELEDLTELYISVWDEYAETEGEPEAKIPPMPDKYIKRFTDE